MNVDLVSKTFEVDGSHNLNPEPQSHNTPSGDKLYSNSGYEKDINTRYRDPQMVDNLSHQPFNRDQPSVQYKNLERTNSKDLPIETQNPAYINQKPLQDDSRNMPSSQRQYYAEQPNNEMEQYRYNTVQMPDQSNQGYEFQNKQTGIPPLDSNKMGYQTEQYQYGQGNEQDSSPSYQWSAGAENSQNLDPMYNVQQSEPLR